jgi:hypothetical protein
MVSEAYNHCAVISSRYKYCGKVVAQPSIHDCLQSEVEETKRYAEWYG